MQHITQKNNCSISEFAIGSFCLPFVIDHFQSIWQCVYFGEIREDYVKPFFNRILICINIFVVLDKNISPHNSSICAKNRWPSQGEEKNKRDKEREGQIQSRFYSPFSVMTPLSPTFTDSLLLIVILMQEKEQKREEIKRLKNLKRKEIMEKLEKLKGP